MCSCTTDFKIAREGPLAFTETGPAEIIGFTELLWEEGRHKRVK
jgi:hypothetical protein